MERFSWFSDPLHVLLLQFAYLSFLSILYHISGILSKIRNLENIFKISIFIKL